MSSTAQAPEPTAGQACPPQAIPPIDVLGLGVTAVDDLLYVPAYPPPDTKVPVRRRERHGGGLTATALVAAARLGARCAYAGALGDDELSRFVAARLAAEGINLSWLRRRPDARPVHSVVIVDETHHTRNIFYYSGAAGADPDWPDADVIRAARVLFVDHWGIEGMLRAARIARAAGIPIVGDLENDSSPQFAALLALVDHVIVSHAFACRLTGSGHPAEAAARLWAPGRSAVVVTCGAEGCWYLGGSQQAAQHLPAYQVEVVDTTGCGDVFHGAYAAALARGLDLAARVRVAAAAAALKATQPGGQAGIPTRDALEAFLVRHERSMAGL